MSVQPWELGDNEVFRFISANTLQHIKVKPPNVFTNVWFWSQVDLTVIIRLI